LSWSGSSSRRGRVRRARLFCAALALLGSGCDKRFDFDVPAPAERADAGSRAATDGCSGDQDCGLESLHCDATQGRCVECVVDQDCGEPDRPRCDGVLNRCVGCKVARDCPTGSSCDSATQRCLRSCREEVDCALTDHDCDERRGVCLQCDDDAECATSEGGRYCASDGTGCVQCRLDAQCGAGAVCDLLLGRCVACRDTRDCAPGTFCDPVAHGCIPPRVSASGSEYAGGNSGKEQP
jgi:Cys-rich repeat protein